MDISQYGPFAAIAAIILAMSVLSSTLLTRALGDPKDWAALIDVPLFILTAGPRAVSAALISISFFTLTYNTRMIFGIAALFAAILASGTIINFYREWKKHTCAVPLVLENGSQAQDASGTPKTRHLIVGTEDTMLPGAKAALKLARSQNPGLSLCDFLGGFGASSTFSADAAWSRETLAGIATSLLLKLTIVLLCAVLALYWAAAIVEITARSG